MSFEIYRIYLRTHAFFTFRHTFPLFPHVSPLRMPFDPSHRVYPPKLLYRVNNYRIRKKQLSK